MLLVKAAKNHLKIQILREQLLKWRDGSVFEDAQKSQWLRVHTALSEDQRLDPSADIRWLTAARNSSFREANTLFWRMRELHLLSYLHIDTHTHN